MKLSGLSAAEIAEQARAGVQVNMDVEVPEIVSPATRRSKWWSRSRRCRARVLLLECTFIGDDVTPAQARAGGPAPRSGLPSARSSFKTRRSC